MKIGIYYPFVPYIGGGERYLFAMSEYLGRKHSVELFIPEHALALQTASTLGYDLSRVRLVPKSGFVSSWEKVFGSRRYDLFICFSNHAVPPVASLGRRGLLLVQFPFPLPSSPPSAWVKTRLLGPFMLASYSCAIVYSRFVARWLKRRSPRKIPISTVSPPVDAPPAAFVDLDAPHRNIILAVGRFFEGGHNKGHEVLVSAFRALVDAGTLTGWELHLAGATRPEPEHQLYLERVYASAEGYPITLHTDIAPRALEALYRDTAVFWHATGYGANPEQEPERMEHFGIVTIEAMAWGCVPMVMAAGGQSEIVIDGVNGFLWRDMTELKACMVCYTTMDVTTVRGYRAAAVQTAARYTPAAFHAKLEALVNDSAQQIGKRRSFH